MPPQKPIQVTYKYIDGAHFFVTDDKLAAGLCVAHNDLAIAFDEVGVQLSALFKHNYGETVVFRPDLSYESFHGMVDACLRAKNQFDNGDVVVLSTIQPWMIHPNN